MRQFHDQWLEYHTSVKDLVLYHYTTPEGLNGILESRSLRCGHASYFNDPNEIMYGMELILEALHTERASESRGDIQAFLDGLKMYVEITFTTYRFDPFIACFCESSTLLSQWRNYATGGMGYCIGFNFSDTTYLAHGLDSLSQDRRAVLRRVIYLEEMQRELINQYISLMVEGAKNAMDAGTHRGREWHHIIPVMAVQAANHLIDMILSFKHPEYKEENEWRMVWITREDHLVNNIGIRNSNHTLIPYRTAYLFENDQDSNPTFPIHSICYGPAQDSSLAKLTLDILIRRYESDHHPIKLNRSDIVIEEPGYRLRWP